ncbi:PhoX family phosphatase [Granulosicoccus sp.]|nr:PhoX family phosphatase [Granulosicoccus sp.]MDB4222612.1 PhoX family phosphatase [Granulosicoccus sp.]
MQIDSKINLSQDELDDLSFDDYDEAINPKPEVNDFDAIVEQALSRRGFMKGVLAFGGAATLGVTTTALTSISAEASNSRFGFTAVAASTADTIIVPEGYNWHVATRWGDPLFSDAPEFDHATRGTAASQARAFGDNNDGMSMFSDRHGRQILVVNNEYTNRSVMWGNNPDGKYVSDDDINKGKNAHGLSAVELKLNKGKWQIVKDSSYNRRFTPDEPMDITGPARAHDMMKTNADPAGTTALGTFNNCGNGRTPWGTYLACEENFNGYFGTGDPDSYEQDVAKKRYGISGMDRGYGWWKVDDRFDVAKDPNESNRHGYITEVDPYNPKSKPKKRTALGRFKHENAEVVVNSDGRIAIYMGDDERGEFLYRYLSDGFYAEGGNTDDLMENGTIYVAKFNPDGTGKWLALTSETTGMDKATICIHTRMAASKVGATTMDRPEWVAANPLKAEVYCALTNNRNRGLSTNAGGDKTPVGGPNPREANKYGQIVRWWPANADHTASGFKWDLYVMAGNPTVYEDSNAGSDNLTPGNMFNSPDGLSFDNKGLLWIQTDGNYSNENDFAGQGNNQMLIGDPTTGEIRRFLVGPRQAEITGIAWAADRRTVFVGVQHPGERGDSNWPDGGDKTPRSSVVAVRRDDGGTIG